MNAKSSIAIAIISIIFLLSCASSREIKQEKPTLDGDFAGTLVAKPGKAVRKKFARVAFPPVIVEILPTLQEVNGVQMKIKIGSRNKLLVGPAQLSARSGDTAEMGRRNIKMEFHISITPTIREDNTIHFDIHGNLVDIFSAK